MLCQLFLKVIIQSEHKYSLGCESQRLYILAWVFSEKTLIISITDSQRKRTHG